VPQTGPADGLTPATVGTFWKVNWSAGLVADVPPGVTTVTSTVPAEAAGDVAVIEVGELTTKLAGVVPKSTADAFSRSVPVTVTLVLPPVGPTEGLIPVTAGTFWKVNWSAGLVADVPPGVITVTSTVPAEAAGDVAVTDVGELTVKLEAGVGPKSTTEAFSRSVPVIVTVVPPPVGPTEGLTPVTAGTFWKVNWSAELVADVPPGVTTVTSTVPAEPAGEVVVMEVSELMVKLAGVDPKSTADALR
jgi:hypothetical protein